MGVINTKPKVYYSVPTKSSVDTCEEFSSINMTNYSQKDGVRIKPSVQKSYWDRVLKTNKGGGKSSPENG
jgi:hypothetical protein